MHTTHTVCLQCIPTLGALVGIINTAYILFVISTPYTWHFNNLTGQGVAIVLCTTGIVGTFATSLILPFMIRKSRQAAPIIRPVKRMNLLGLVSGCKCCIYVSMPRVHAL